MSENTMVNSEFSQQYMTFNSSEHEYGIGLTYVNEIIPIPTQPITPVPGMPEYLRGIINLRGTIVPIIDVRIRFGLLAEGYDERTCIIVINLDELPIGMIVDSVQEVLTVRDEEMSIPPRGMDSLSDYVSHIVQPKGEGGPVVQLLNVHKLFYDEMEPEADAAALA